MNCVLKGRSCRNRRFDCAQHKFLHQRKTSFIALVHVEWFLISHCEVALKRYQKFSAVKISKTCRKYPENGTVSFYYRVMGQKDADGMANSVDPYQTAPLRACPHLSVLKVKIITAYVLHVNCHCSESKIKFPFKRKVCPWFVDNFLSYSCLNRVWNSRLMQSRL